MFDPTHDFNRFHNAELEAAERETDRAEEIGNHAQAFVDEIQDPAVDMRNLESLLQTFGDAGLFPDGVDSVSVEQAITCWKIIERVKAHRGNLPERMTLSVG